MILTLREYRICWGIPRKSYQRIYGDTQEIIEDCLYAIEPFIEAVMPKSGKGEYYDYSDMEEIEILAKEYLRAAWWCKRFGAIKEYEWRKWKNRTFVLFYCSKLYTFEKFFVIMFKVTAWILFHAAKWYLVLENRICDFCLPGFVKAYRKAVILRISLRIIKLAVGW